MLKKFAVLMVIMAILIAISPKIAVGSPLFSADFESDLSGWAGQGGWPHHGVIIADPLNPGNNVLGFTDWNSMGDIYTIAAFSAPAGEYVLSFDYMGDPSMGGIAGDLGGYIGYSYGFPGYHVWLAGTGSGWGGPDLLNDDGAWHHYEIYFSDPNAFHMMLEDFKDVGGIDIGGVRGDVYFDNIVLSDFNSAIPEPASMLLLGLSLLGAGALKKKRKF